MDWLRNIVKGEEVKKLKFGLRGTNTYMFEGLHTGSYKLTHEARNSLLTIKVRHPVLSSLWQVKLEIDIQINSPPSALVEKHALSKNFVVTLNYNHPEADFETWSYLALEPYANRDVVEWNVKIKVLEHHGLPNSHILKIVDRIEDTSDLSIIINDRTIRCQRSMITTNSTVLYERILKSDRERLEMNDVDYDQFVMFLAVMHGFIPNINYKTYEYLFDLCYRFNATMVRTMLISNINQLETKELVPFLLMAETYSLTVLKQSIIDDVTLETQLIQMMADENYSHLSAATRNKLRDNIYDDVRIR